MNPETYARVKELFQEASELDPAAWPDFLRERAGDDTEVREELARRLAGTAVRRSE